MKLLQYMPDRTKLFLAAFWLWTWILLQFNKLCAIFLQCVLVWVPDSYTPTLSQKTPIRVIKALDKDGNTITNKLKLFLNLKWDKEMCDDKGGVDIDTFMRYIGSSLIWAAYILEYELSPIYNDFIQSVSGDDFSSKDINKLLKAIVIDVGNKLVYKLGNEQSETLETSEPLMFGEVNFHSD
jgi:hypothetical protein